MTLNMNWCISHPLLVSWWLIMLQCKPFRRACQAWGSNVVAHQRRCHLSSCTHAFTHLEALMHGRVRMQ